MTALKYKIIKSKTQYNNYCEIFEELVSYKQKSRDIRDEIDLLALIILKYDEENAFKSSDPIKLINALMEEREMKAKDLVEILGISKGLVSDILNYRKGLSKTVIKTLSDHFQVSQEAFNRPYKLKSS